MLNQDSHLINALEAIDTALKIAKRYLTAFPFIIIAFTSTFVSIGKPIWSNLQNQNPTVILLFFGLFIYMISILVHKFIAGKKLVKEIETRENLSKEDLIETQENLNALPDKLYLSVTSGLVIGYTVIILIFWSDFAEIVSTLKIGQNPLYGSLWLGPALLVLFPLLFLTVGIWQRNKRLEQNYLAPINQISEAIQKL